MLGTPRQLASTDACIRLEWDYKQVSGTGEFIQLSKSAVVEGISFSGKPFSQGCGSGNAPEKPSTTQKKITGGQTDNDIPSGLDNR